jgi:propanediol utilization protein
VLLVEVNGTSVSYDLYEVHDEHRLAHGIVEGEAATSVLQRLQEHFGDHAIVAQRIHPATGCHVIPVGVSVRHVHLDRVACDALFGPGYQLQVQRAITQPGQFVARETLDLIGPRGELSAVAIIGPLRPESQIELSRTDAIHLGVAAPLRESGHLAGTPGVTLRGPCGAVTVDHGAIIAQRHVHMNPEEARRLGLRDHDVIQVQAVGDREVVLGDVIVRVAPEFALDLHVDTDEANAAGLEQHATVEFAGIERHGG